MGSEFLDKENRLKKERLQAGKRLEKEEKRAAASIHTFLTTCDLTLIRREQNEGREMLVLTFTPRPEAQFQNSEKYILQLKGVIWIDAEDRIVTRLVGLAAK